MNAELNPRPLFSEPRKVNGLGSQGPPTSPFYWSVRRELWENRSLYIALLIVCGIVVFGWFVRALDLPQLRRNALALDPVHQRAAIEAPYDMAAMVLILTAFIVGVFYCLDALYGERRDRSILFWKSLPVSDLTAVLSKATIPLAILPLVTFIVIVTMHLVMLLISTFALLSSGLAATTWANFNFFRQSFILLYGLVAIALWHAPIYGWLLLVSAWARRATFLWAVLPFIAIQIFEKITFGTNYVGKVLQDRLLGFALHAFGSHGGDHPTINSLAQLTPGQYLSSPGLWLGFIFAAAFIAAAVRLRRYHGPL
jgi:ABC-2 type transport system permease protein